MTLCHILYMEIIKMPTGTFFNLEELKREKIINASIKEFSRAPFDKASIKNIVNGAGIPRGSFYQYFKNKEDVYIYVIRQVVFRKCKEISKVIAKNKGDLFAAFEEIFKDEFEIFSHRKFHNLMKNFIARTRTSVHSEVIMKQLHNMGEDATASRAPFSKDHHKDLLSLINRNLYSLKDNGSYMLLVRILLRTMGEIMLLAEAKKMTAEEAFHQYEEVIRILKYGVLKKKKV